MSCARYRFAKAALALVLFFGVFVCLGCFGTTQAHAANKVTVTQASTPSLNLKATSSKSYTYSKILKAKDSAKNTPKTYHVGDLYCTTKSSVSFVSLFGGFAASNDKVYINGTYIDTDTKKASDAIENGALDSSKIATQSVKSANDGEAIETTYGELQSKGARVVLYYAASAKSNEADAVAENLATLKAKNSVNGKYAPALFVTENVDGIDQTRILQVSSIKFVDQNCSGKYATASVGSWTYNGGKAAPKATLTYCGKSLSASAKSDNINVTSSAKAKVTATVDGKQISKDGITFAIKPASLKSASLGYGSTTYNGTYKKPSVSAVYANGVSKKLSSSEYAVSYQNNLNAGTARVVVSGKGNYSGSVTKTFKINKAKQYFTVDTSVKNESWRSTQAGNHGTAKYTVKGAKGKVTFTKIGGSSRLKVNGATSQRLMVKRGTAKGTYTAKIRVTAGATANYAATSKVVNLKVRLK